MSEPATKRRRVPEDQRKRAQQSCDLCKKRRCKCVCTAGSEICQSCQKSGVPCTWSAPTKTRFYGNVEDLADRYRCLEAIVKGAFPDEPIATTRDLLRLGERQNYEMPDLSTSAPKRLEEIVRYQEDASHSSHPPESDQSLRAASQETENDPSVAPPETSSSTARLVHDTAGRVHYIGPSGSLTFFAELRELVASYQQDTAHGDISKSSFAGDNIAEALEAEDAHDGDLTGQELDGISAEIDVSSPVSTMSHRTAGTNPFDLDEQLRHLPSREVMESLITSYFDHCHDDLPLFHRATFQDQYESFVLMATKREPQTAARPDHGWLACLHMVLVFGSLSTSSSSNLTSATYHNVQRLSAAAAHSFLPVLTTKCVLSNIQALVLLCLYFHNNKDRNAAWNLVGTAIRMAFAIGLHNDLDSRFRPVERETRKRVWCTLYTFDQFLCSSLGRPSGSADSDVEVRVPIEGLLDGGNGAGEYFAEQNLRLHYILASVRRLMGLRHQSHAAPQSKRAAKTTQKPTDASILTNQSILQDLDRWKNGLPSHLQLPKIVSSSGHKNGVIGDGLSFDQLRLSLSRQNPRPLRALILLHVQYYHIVMLVTRPILLAEIASSRSAVARGSVERESAADRDTVYSSLSQTSKSVLAAAQISSLTLLLDSFSLLNGTSGLDIFYAYSSAMVLLLRILWVQHTTAKDSINQEAERKSSLRDLVANLRATVGKTKKSKTMKRFAGVMNKFAEMVEDIDSSRAAVSDGLAFVPEGKTRRPLQPVNRSNSDVRTDFDLQQRNPAPLPVEQSFLDQNISQPPRHQHQLPTNNAASFNAVTPSATNTTFSPAPYIYPSQSPASGSSASPFTSYHFWPQLASGTTPSTNNTSSTGEMVWHDDPLNALANGQVFEWTDLDAFIGGQLE